MVPRVGSVGEPVLLLVVVVVVLVVGWRLRVPEFELGGVGKGVAALGLKDVPVLSFTPPPWKCRVLCVGLVLTMVSPARLYAGDCGGVGCCGCCG